MIQFNHQQGSPEWHASRAGVITASMFSSARYKTKKGEWSSEARGYAFRLALERIGGKPLDDGVDTWAMKRGRDLEPAARSMHAKLIGQDIAPCGFFTDNSGVYGASPDGLIGDEGCAEYKCLVDPARIAKVLLQDDLSEFMDQIQGHMWITGRVWCDFCIYLPQLEAANRAMYRKRVYGDSGYISQMAKDLAEFNNYVGEMEAAVSINLPITCVEPF